MYPLDLSVAAGAPACTVFELGIPNGDPNPKPPAYDGASVPVRIAELKNCDSLNRL